jgi:hypothetical protein
MNFIAAIIAVFRFKVNTQTPFFASFDDESFIRNVEKVVLCLGENLFQIL